MTAHMDAATRQALDRVLALAGSDTGQARIARRFILAWWNPADLGGFDLTDLFVCDRAVAADLARIFSWLGDVDQAVYPHEFIPRDRIVRLIELQS